MSSRTSNFQYAIRDMVAAAEEVERRGVDVIKLNIGDPQAFGFRPPEHVVDAVQRALAERFTGYSHSAGLYEAREAIAGYAEVAGTRTTPEDVIVTSGASEAADLVLTALVDPGEEVLIPGPGYPIYTAILNKLGAVPVYYNLHSDSGWQPHVDEIESKINERTRAILLINPNNPTGAITRDATTRRLLELATEQGLVVISDEVYRDLCFTEPPTAASTLAADIRVPVVTLESLSKTHLVPGWRIGWMRFTNAEMVPELVRGVTQLASGRLCSPTPAQYAVKQALEGDNSFRDAFMTEIRSRRDTAVAGVDSIDGFSCTVPDAAFYLMVKAERQDESDAEFVLRMLHEAHVLCVPGSGFGADPKDGYFRLVYLASEAELTATFKRIGAMVN